MLFVDPIDVDQIDVPEVEIGTTLIYPPAQLHLKNKQPPSKLQCRRNSQEWQIDGWNAIQDQSCFKVYQQHRRAGCTYRLPKLWQAYIPALDNRQTTST